MSVVLKAEKREKLGTAAARRIKNLGRIPAVIYAQNNSINLSVGVKEFEHEYFKGVALTTVFEIELDSKKIKAIAHKVELDPVSDRPVHIDFIDCANSKTIRAKPKLVFVNQDKSPGLKKGGFLHVVLRRVEVTCDSEKLIPNVIEIDASRLQVTHKVRASNLVLPEGVKLTNKKDFLIASIIGRGKAEEEKVAAPAAAAAAATPAKADEKKADKK